ncbi:MAG: hypothetical protein ACD_11C00110G0009 [uncultured bacterium]|nr:MAG: hypothetical protein ACD_11C00110G0009 [uncultured bacterium]
MDTTKIVLFQNKEIRRELHNGEWWFSVIDVISVLTESDRPRKYWSDLKKKLIEEGYIELSEKIGQLKLQSSDGKYYLTDCANTETMFRIVQSIPSPKVESIKRWLAKTGFERVQEIENPAETLQAEQGKSLKKD